MPSHAIVTNYGNERVDELGTLRVDAYALIHDPEMQGMGAGLDARVIVSNGIEISDTSFATWSTAIKDAIVSSSIEIGFTDLISANVLIPTMA